MREELQSHEALQMTWLNDWKTTEIYKTIVLKIYVLHLLQNVYIWLYFGMN